MYSKSKIRQLASAAFVYSGFSRYARRLHRNQPCVLMFHGLREDGDEGLLDVDLHLEERLFTQVCEHLARYFHVAPLQEIWAAAKRGEKLPSGTVAITFDDGYASNHHLAFPILKRLGLPATIFPATGFIDKTELPWFLRLEFTVAKSQRRNVRLEIDGKEYTSPFETFEERHALLAQIQKIFKAVPQEQVVPLIEYVEKELDCAMESGDEWPDIFQPMTWDEARELKSSGLIDFGGHTHHHLILSRCEPETLRREVRQCRERVTEELGAAPRSFAYPNGQIGDHNRATAALLREEGFNLAVTTEAGFLHPHTDPFELPRHGSPLSSYHANATVSGAFETFKQWRKSPFRLPRPAWS